jgi:hypothetical protein
LIRQLPHSDREVPSVARRLSDEQREAIIADLRATAGTIEGAYRRVAERCGVSNGIVAKIAQECGVNTCTRSRDRTEAATRAKVADNAARRADLAALLLDRALEALADMSEPALVYNFGGKDNTYAEKLLSRPDFGGRLNLMRTAAQAIASHKVLDQYDSDAAQASAMDAWLKVVASGGKIVDDDGA